MAFDSSAPRMIHARSDYDRIQDPSGKIPVDEPVFLIRGQDPHGAEAIEKWLEIQQRENPEIVSQELASAIRIHAAKMRHWAQNCGHGKVTVDPRVLKQF